VAGNTASLDSYEWKSVAPIEDVVTEKLQSSKFFLTNTDCNVAIVTQHGARKQKSL
jgi:hypothetical protein